MGATRTVNTKPTYLSQGGLEKLRGELDERVQVRRAEVAGRTVELTTPIVKNVRPAIDTTVSTTELAPGVKKRIETPTAGQDVWVTRIVRDKDGVVIHRETYYSHYSRVDGIVQIGISAPTPTPAPTPAPTPSLP